MRTYGYAKSTDPLGRYYTQTAVSDLLVGLLPVISPLSVLDLGAGQGSLSLAASNKWNEAELITIDIDNTASHILSQRLLGTNFKGRHHHLPSDALSSQLQSLLSQKNISPPCVAVCNPPFLVPKWRKGYSEILEDAGFSSALPAITSTDAAAIFLAQNLRLIAAGGTLGIIVPDSLVSAEKYQGYRESLLDRYDIVQAIRLPRGSFVGTDALAHILVVRNQKPTLNNVLLSSYSRTDGISQQISIPRDQAVKRLDYSYHAAQPSDTTAVNTLSSIVIDLRRGNINSAQVKSAAHFILHTTDLKTEHRGQWLDFKECSHLRGGIRGNTAVAEKGDIVIARVGRNAAEKIIGIASGSVPLSDCLFRLRVAPKHRKALLTLLVSPEGQRWFEMHAYGVAARHISKGDLLNFPLSRL